MRECPKHGLVVFHRYRDRRLRSGYHYRCKRCVGEAVTRRHRKMRAILVAEAGGRCQVPGCGYDRCIYSLVFHHVDPSTKALRMTVSSGRSLAAYREKAKKCVLVCANYHAAIEAGLTPCPPQPAPRPCTR